MNFGCRSAGLRHEYNRYVAGDRGQGLTAYEVLRFLFQELAKRDIPTDNDAVCYVIAAHLLGGNIAQLEEGMWVNHVPNGEGVAYYDLCGVSRRTTRPIGIPDRLFNFGQFAAEREASDIMPRVGRIVEGLHVVLRES